jgi:hypothetical protein
MVSMKQGTGQALINLTVDTAHLLSDHDSRCAVVCSPDSRHCEAIPHTGEVARAASEPQLLNVDDVRVVVVSGCNDRVCAQNVHGLETLGVTAVLHEPTGRFRAEEDTDCQNERWNEGRSKLKAPCDRSGVFDDHVGAEAQEDTSNNPKLPKHDECATNTSGSHLCRVYRYCSVLRTDTDAHDEAGGE